VVLPYIQDMAGPMRRRTWWSRAPALRRSPSLRSAANGQCSFPTPSRRTTTRSTTPVPREAGRRRSDRAEGFDAGEAGAVIQRFLRDRDGGMSPCIDAAEEIVRPAKSMFIVKMLKSYCERRSLAKPPSTQRQQQKLEKGATFE